MHYKAGYIKGLAVAVAAAMAALAFAGCSRDDRSGSGQRQALEIVPIMQNLVKSAGGFPEDVQVGVYAWEYEAGVAPEEGGAILGNACMAYAGGAWQLPVEAWWPTGAKLLAVVAYAPYTAASAYKKGKGVCWEGIDLATSVPDLLYSELRTGLRSSVGTVNLPMKHALASMDFSLKHNAAAGVEITLGSIVVEGLRWKGSFCSLPEPAWTVEGEAADKTFFTGEAALGYEDTPVGETLQAIPQSLSGGKVKISLTKTEAGQSSDYTLTGNLPNTYLECGRHYTLTIAINADTLEFVTDIIKN